MKKYIFISSLFLSACGQPATDSAEPVEYDGTLTECQMANGDPDMDYSALLIFTNDPHKVLFGVGNIDGNDTWLLTSEATLKRPVSSILQIDGVFDPMGEQTEEYHMHLFNNSHSGNVTFDYENELLETCKAQFYVSK